MKIDNAFYDLEESDVCFAGIPYIKSKTPVPLSKKGPDLLRKGLNNKDDYDVKSNKCVFDELRICDYGNIEINRINNLFSKGLGKTFFFLGGEHSITYHIIKSLSEFEKNFSLIVFDAHLDLRKNYEPNSCFLYKILDFFPFNKVFLSGQRVYSQEEYDYFRKKKLKRLNSLKNQKIYISFDIDVLDSIYVPTASTPEPGGINIMEAEGLLTELVRNNKLLGIDFVEFASKKYDITYSNISYLVMTVLKTLLNN